MTTLLVIGALGLGLLLVSLVVGDLLDGLLDGLSALEGDAFSSAVIGAFVSAFGFGGAIAAGASLPTALVVVIGVAAGVVFGWFALWLTRLVRGGGSDAVPSAEATVGLDASVVSDVPAAGYGTVVVRLGGHTLRLNARGRDDVAIPTGTPAHVTAVLSPSAVEVAPVWEHDLPPSDPPRPLA